MTVRLILISAACVACLPMALCILLAALDRIQKAPK